MNKLIKSAMMMASVGAMLCIVGCGEKTPVQQACSTFEEVNSIMRKSGFSMGMIPQEKMDELRSGKLSTNDVAQAIELAQKAQTSLGKLKTYVKLLHDVNGVLDADEKIKEEDIVMCVVGFSSSTSEEQDKFIKDQEEILQARKLLEKIRNNNQ